MRDWKQYRKWQETNGKVSYRCPLFYAHIHWDKSSERENCRRECRGRGSVSELSGRKVEERGVCGLREEWWRFHLFITVRRHFDNTDVEWDQGLDCPLWMSKCFFGWKCRVKIMLFIYLLLINLLIFVGNGGKLVLFTVFFSGQPCNSYLCADNIIMDDKLPNAWQFSQDKTKKNNKN